MKILTVSRIIYRIAIIIALVELFITLILGNIPHDMEGDKLLFAHLAFLSIINVVSLVVLASPLIYFGVVKPFVDERDQAISKANQLAHYDPLTSLANRRLIEQNLRTLISECTRYQLHGALILLDLNKFKVINDVHGHDAGDAILIDISKRLSELMRGDDIVGRIGGDEFVVLIHHLGNERIVAEQKVSIIANKLYSIINEPIEYKNAILEVGVSIGIVILDDKPISLASAFKQADLAMYRSKEHHTKFVTYDSIDV